MIFKRIMSLLICSICIMTSFPIYAFAYDKDEEDVDYSEYNNMFFKDDEDNREPIIKKIKIHSINNSDKESLWRPKYDELSIDLKDTIEYKNSNTKVDVNGFDVGWSEVSKNTVPTSRELELLGYDFLLSNERLNSSNGKMERTLGYKQPITAPYFVMNIYKALGIELYDVFIDNKGSDFGISITRTNINSYWNLFMNDHPINYGAYNDSSVSSALSGKVITTADAVVILAQMLDFYGEPVISKKEEYMLLQVYGNDVPNDLTDVQKEAWSYLKCRGIIGEKEYSYKDNITFNDMMELLMRASDKSSRTNFKEVQITTTLEDSFIDNGFYSTDINIVNQESIGAEEVKIDYSGAERIDFLVEINDDIAFKFNNTGELNKNIFISDEPNHDSKPIRGSIFEGLIDGRFYHFSIPKTEIEENKPLYINSNNESDRPLNYSLPNTNGGVYSENSYTSINSYVSFSTEKTFDEVMPNSIYVDKSRIERSESENDNDNEDVETYEFNGNVIRTTTRTRAASNGITLKATFEGTKIDIEKTRAVIQELGGTLETKDKNVIISINSRRLGYESGDNVSRLIGRLLVLKDEYRFVSSTGTKAILGLTGERLLIDIDEAKKQHLIKGYEAKPDDNILIIYTYDGDIIIVDNKKKTIQKGNTYIQLRENQPLYKVDNGHYTVDFRALFGTKELGFRISNDNGNTTVNFYSNKIGMTGTTSKGGVSVGSGYIHRHGDYVWENTIQSYCYTNSEQETMTTMNVDLLYKFNGSKSIEKVLLPMSSSNPLGNYILYGVMNSNTAQEEWSLVRVTPTKICSYSNGSDSLDKLFAYKPDKIPLDKYSISVTKLTSDNNIGFEYVDGVGWCYNLEILGDDGDGISFMSEYRSPSPNKSFLPFTFTSAEKPRLINYNINYMSEDELNSLSVPSSDTYNEYVLAPVSLQTWFSNPEFVPTLSMDTVKSYGSSPEKAPILYWGSMEARVSESGNIITMLGDYNISNNSMDNLNVIGMNRTYKNNLSYMNPGIYTITTNDFNISINNSQDNGVPDVSKIPISALDFFDSFKDITFMDFILNLDNMMSSTYYIVTRVIPLIILSLLVLILLISMVADIKIVQMFCDRVFDPITILTFGNHNIHSIQGNKFLVFSLIGALTLMGLIQAGVLEDLIMYGIEWYYAFKGLFSG